MLGGRHPLVPRLEQSGVRLLVETAALGRDALVPLLVLFVDVAGVHGVELVADLRKEPTSVCE